MVEIILIDQLECNWHACVAIGHVLAAARAYPLITQVGRFVESEFEVDRIGRNNSGQQRRISACAAGDKIAWRYPPIANAAIHRGAQFSELHVELSLTHRCLVIAYRSLRVTKRLCTLLERLISNGLVAYKLLATGIVRLGKRDVGLCLH